MGFATKPTLKYLDLRPKGPLGGRGNAVRLFLLANKIGFEEKLVSFEKWGGGEKKRVQESGEQPGGHLPVLQVGEKHYAEHMAICRYAARAEGLYGKDIELDYEVDAVGDAQSEWRTAWASALGEEEGSPKLKAYLEKRDGYYDMMEMWYKMRASKGGPYLVDGDVPGFGDCATFNIMRDDALVCGKRDLSVWPNLKALYEVVDKVPEVRKWIEDWEARKV